MGAGEGRTPHPPRAPRPASTGDEAESKGADVPADSTGQGVGVHVTVFGKHAGWPGSIEDIGLTCEELTRAKRSLYLLGMGANADSGAWDKVAPDERVVAYPSVVLWRLGANLVVARLWSSRGGQPMFACALAQAMPHAWTLEAAGPILEQVGAKASQTSSPELVRLSVGEARRELEDKALIAAARREQPGPNLAELMDHADLGPSREGLLRVMGHLERSLSASEGKAVNLRVPRCLADPSRAGLAWIEIIAGEVPAGTPILAMAGPDRDWVDLVVGEPKASNLVCAKLNERAMSLTTRDAPPPADEGAARRRLDLLLRDTPATTTPRARRKVSPLVPVLIIALMLVGTWLLRGTNPGPPADQKVTGGSSGKPASLGSGQGERASESTGPGEGAVRASLAQAQAAVEALEADAAGEGRAVDPSLMERVRQATRRLEAIQETQNPSERAAQRRELVDLSAASEGVRQVVQKAIEESRQRLGTMLDERAQRPAQASDAMRRIWTREVRAIDPAAGWRAARQRLDALEPTLNSTEQGVVSATRIPVDVLSDPAPMTGAIARGVEGWMERAGEAAAKGQDVDAVLSAARRWTGEVEGLIAQASRLETGLRGAYAPDESIGEGTSLLGAVRALRDSNLPAGFAQALKPLLDKVNDTLAIQDLKDASALAGLVRAGSTTQASDLDKARAVLAWQRLGSLGYPRTSEEIAATFELREQAAHSAQNVTPQRRQVLGSRVRRTARHMVEGFLDRCANSDEQAPMFDAMGRLGYDLADEPTLPAWTRFNLERWRLGGATRRGAGFDPEAKSAALADAAQEFVRKVADIEGAKAACDNVREALDPWASLDLESVGPGKAGWRVVRVSPDASEVVYARATRRVPEQHVAFRRLGAGGAAQSVTYLATNETSVGVFAAGVLGSLGETKGGEAIDTTPIEAFGAAISASYARGGVDPRRGVRSWDWGRRHDEFVVPAYEDSDPPSRGWMRHRPGMEGRSYFPEGGAIDPPAWDSPMQYVSPVGALASARLMGCRLPTPEEWKAASANPGPTNLRDPAWAGLLAHVRASAGYQPEWPTAGIFRAKGEQGPLPDEDDTLVTEVVDGWAWLASTRLEGARFAHIVGNMGEYVFEDAPGMEALADPTPGAAEVLLGSMERLWVVGGSALGAHMTMGRTMAVDPGEAMEGFADVGFRLAFSADRKCVAAPRALRRLEEAIEAVRGMEKPPAEPGPGRPQT